MPRIRAHSRVARFAHLAPRLAFVAVTTASVVAGVIAGCGIDFAGSLVREGGAGEDAVADANLPPEGGGEDGSGSGDAGADVANDNEVSAVACAASQCAAQGGGCDPVDHSCTFRCDAGGSCAGPITCPPGVPCHVVCAGADSCTGKVDCLQATACNIECAGKHTCAGVACAGSDCNVQCSGMDSCRTGTVECTAKTSCRIACNGTGSNNCVDPVTCASAACSVLCADNACTGGVTATAPDASILCGNNACGPGATCYASYCQLACKGGSCANELCCDAGTCLIDGGPNTCP